MKTTIHVELVGNSEVPFNAFERSEPYAGIPIDFLDGFWSAANMFTGGNIPEMVITIRVKKEE